MAILTARADVEYAVPDAAIRLLWELDPGVAFLGDPIRLRLYPSVDAKVAATAGTAKLTFESRIRRVAYEIVTFEGGDSARTEYPITGAFSYQSLGASFDKGGNPVSPVLTWDPASGEIAASQRFWGGFQVAYDAAYRIVEYTPELQKLSGGGIKITAGSVLAYYRNEVEVFPVRYQFADETEQDVVELYSVSSTTIKDPSGEWELPPGWPDDNAYPGLNVTGPDAGNSVDQARVHEVGYVNLRGATRRNNFHTPNLQPYVNASSYRPAKTYRRASPPAAFQQVFLDVDWDKIEAGVKSRHSNLTNL